jgi:hypothetical protein
VACVCSGPDDGGTIHAMETLQCMLERRSGGEGGIRSVRAAFWAAMRRADTEGPQNAAAETPTGGSGWESGGWSGELMEACLSRSQQLRQVEPLQDGGQELTMCVHTCHLSPTFCGFSCSIALTRATTCVQLILLLEARAGERAGTAKATRRSTRWRPCALTRSV